MLSIRATQVQAALLPKVLWLWKKDLTSLSLHFQNLLNGFKHTLPQWASLTSPSKCIAQLEGGGEGALTEQG